ncbi:hypothetical protein chiPu_0005077, partial [Chiloscyllium punctatum]|nr:hypothetical protein [Chiloscyllium punctatum]
VIITTILYLSDALRKNFLNESFDFKVWESYFYLAVIFINQPCLQLEIFSPSKRKKVLEKYGDMRVMMGCEIFSMWQNLGEHKLQFIPGLIGPFLEVTLVPQADLRNVMIPIFHDMMDWEQRRTGNFKQVEAKLIDKLDSLMSEGKGDETYRELFNSIIPLFGPYPSLLKKIERETWRESGISLVATVTRLMERLLDYRDCMKVTEVDGKKIGCTVSLLNFYKTEINKEEMYIRYIHKLYDLHLKAQNFTEAAYTLLLYDELLEWSERPLREFLHYPMQTEWQRKEILHLTIIQNFDKGKNKEFVCRGHDYERLEAFQQRMLNEFPHAIAMQHANQPEETIFQADAQYLQIYAVIPIPDNHEILQKEAIPDHIKSFYRVNNIWRFRYDRPFHKGIKDKENEFKSLWVERTTLTLVQSLPGISRWFEVDRREVVEMSPLENAIEVLENKNQQLRTLITQCQSRQMQNINPLTMCLNGVIDAAVNGGLARYQEAFFVKDYILNHPEDGDKISRLRELMFEQAHILEYGLAVHEKFVPQDMRPLHKKLVDQFFVMKSRLGIQDFPGYARVSPIHLTNGSPRTCRNPTLGAVSPDGARLVNRRSPLSYPAFNRYSSSSLSSQASAEVSNITGQSESSDEVFQMQASPSTSSLSSTHSASPNVTSSAPSSARGSPLLSDKHKHSRENTCLSPRERPCSAIYPISMEPAQQTLTQQIGDPCMPRSDPNLSAPEKVMNPTPSSWSLDSGKEARNCVPDSARLVSPPVPPRPPHTGSPAKTYRSFSPQAFETPPAHPRSPHKSSVQSLTPSPTDYQSLGPVYNSPVLSGSSSSGISSLSRGSVTETTLTDGTITCTLIGSEELIKRENETFACMPPRYNLSEHGTGTSRRRAPLPHSLSVPPNAEPPALPPKPHVLRVHRSEGENRMDEILVRPRSQPRKVSQL